jgi:MtN3 and saliva related transmembrane protein
MNIAENIGFLAALLSVVCLVPQAVKSIVTKDTSSISFWMYLLYFFSVICWLIYGILLESRPIIIKNILVIILSGLILLLKIKNLNEEKKKLEQREEIFNNDLKDKKQQELDENSNIAI